MRAQPGNADEHALYVRSEWDKFHRDGKPLQGYAAAFVRQPRAVLDVGCGAGQELLPYLDTAAVGIDVRRSSVVAGRSLFGARAPLLMVAQSEALPFASARFDVVLCRLALHYMDVRRALAEMSRVLKPGGVLVFQVHHLRYYLRRAVRARTLTELVHALRVMARGAVLELTGRQMPGEVFLLPRSLRRMLDQSGLELAQTDAADAAAPILVARRQ